VADDAALQHRRIAGANPARRAASAGNSGSIIDGLGPLLVLTLAEFGLGAVFGRTLVDQLASYGSLAGAIGLAAKVIFAMFPIIQVWRS
jgi:hypothetical protein